MMHRWFCSVIGLQPFLYSVETHWHNHSFSVELKKKAHCHQTTVKSYNQTESLLRGVEVEGSSLREAQSDQILISVRLKTANIINREKHLWIIGLAFSRSKPALTPSSSDFAPFALSLSHPSAHYSCHTLTNTFCVSSSAWIPLFPSGSLVYDPPNPLRSVRIRQEEAKCSCLQGRKQNMTTALWAIDAGPCTACSCWLIL